MSKQVLRFRNIMVPKQAGELARIRVLAGPDHGTVFVITSFPVTIGRGEQNTIILMDLKTSRQHAELNLQNGQIFIKDLGSAHGLAVNGKNSPFTLLKTQDKIALGETVIEFIGAELGSTQIINMNPPKTVSQIGTGDSGYTKFISNNKTESKAQKVSTSGGASFFEKNKKFILAIGILVILSALLPEAEKKVKKKKTAYTEPQEVVQDRVVSSLNPAGVDIQSLKTSENFYKEGYRELRAKNYLRARVAFETALQINPGHVLAKTYLVETQTTLRKEAETFMVLAQQNIEAGRFKQAYDNFDAVKRLYSRDRNHPKYKEAETRMDQMKEQMKKMETQ